MKKLNVLRDAHDRGMQLTEVANKLGIAPSSLRARTSGNPRLDSLYEIALVLKCEVGDLFY